MCGILLEGQGSICQSSGVHSRMNWRSIGPGLRRGIVWGCPQGSDDPRLLVCASKRNRRDRRWAIGSGGAGAMDNEGVATGSLQAQACFVPVGEVVAAAWFRGGDWLLRRAGRGAVRHDQSCCMGDAGAHLPRTIPEQPIPAQNMRYRAVVFHARRNVVQWSQYCADRTCEVDHD